MVRFAIYRIVFKLKLICRCDKILRAKHFLRYQNILLRAFYSSIFRRCKHGHRARILGELRMLWLRTEAERSEVRQPLASRCFLRKLEHSDVSCKHSSACRLAKQAELAGLVNRGDRYDKIGNSKRGDRGGNKPEMQIRLASKRLFCLLVCF